MGRHSRIHATILRAIVTLVILSFSAVAAADPPSPAPAPQPAAKPGAKQRMTDQERLRELYAVRKRILEDHVGKDVTADDLHEALMKGMVARLNDRYSAYLSPEEAKASNESLNGGFSGIGIGIDVSGEVPRVTHVVIDGPAHRAGLQKDDRIVAINGVGTKGLDGSGVVSKLKGPSGTKVHVTVERDGCGTNETYEIVRAVVRVKAVTYRTEKFRGKRIAVIKVTSFNTSTAALFNLASDAALRDGVDGMVVDIRDNGGGYLDSVQFVACQWLPSAAVVTWEYERRKLKPLSCTSNRAPLGRLPSVVLVNGDSASASEILAGALQDHGKALIVGETTFGKGVGQAVIPLASGAQLRLTTFEWRTPKKHPINGKGVEPDVKVGPKAEGAKESDPDPQLLKAFDALTAPKQN